MTAPRPAGLDGHFGPEWRRFVLAQYHEAQTTMPRLVKLLRSLGICISKRQPVRLLIEGQDGFVSEAREVLRAGLSSAPWITVDDTGARHKASNGFCTQTGNAHFTWFGTTGSKSRLNFLELLRAGYDGYVVNAGSPCLHARARPGRLSGGTRSDIGRNCRDPFLSIVKTCAKLKIAFWDYLGDRLAVPNVKAIPHLPDIIRAAARMT
jgi:hypothetical protein